MIKTFSREVTMRAKTVQQHKLDGTYRERRHGSGGPIILSVKDIRKPPKRLNAAAVKLWRAEAVPLIDAGIMTIADLSMFTDLIELTAAYRALMSEINGQFVQTGSEGQAVKHPGWQICRDMLSQINGMRRDFGLSPISRGKLPAAQKKPEEDCIWAQFETPMRKYEPK
jgi:P27 family predicted phage terminase small subunit